MGFCSPNYRKTVNEKEKQVNEEGKDTLSFPVKLALFLTASVSLLSIILI
ncbi:hypothetical protein [Bacillus salacetis]|nr:hypothetical protein [Bacillus salacetis]